MGLRLGAGYVWSAYTGLFFSPLLARQADSATCVYSYDFTAQITGNAGGAAVCGAAYPYCVKGMCSALSQSPWHNQVCSIPHLALS
jgi:hypothetical protein